MPNQTVSHNACSVSSGSISRINVSYLIELEMCDYTCTDLVGEFSIIDPAFQVDTYGTHLSSDRSFLLNYVVRRCFVEFLKYLPSYFEHVPLSFSVLHSTSSSDGLSVYICRCNFNPSKGEPLPNIDFTLSLAVESVGALTNRKDTQK